MGVGCLGLVALGLLQDAPRGEGKPGEGAERSVSGKTLHSRSATTSALVALAALGVVATVCYQLQMHAPPQIVSGGACPASGCNLADQGAALSQAEHRIEKVSSDVHQPRSTPPARQPEPSPAEPGRATSKFVKRALASLDSQVQGSEAKSPPSDSGRPAAAAPGLNVFSNCQQGQSGSERTAEKRDQLECLGELAASDVAMTSAEVTTLMGKVQELHSQLSDASDAPLAAADFALAVQGSLRRRCGILQSDLAARRQSPRSSQGAVAALRELQGLEAAFREAAAALEGGSSALGSATGAGAPERLARLKSLGASAHGGLLEAVREARLLAAALPRKDPRVQEAASAEPFMLQAVETFALEQLSGASDAASVFNVGLYWSDVGNGGAEAPLFGLRRVDAGWARDEQGAHVPADIARAEELMRRGQQLIDGPAERDERAAARALRLYQHAKLLAVAHHDAAAEWRYRTSAHLAAAHRRQRLASHSLTRLSYFYLLRGRHQDALATASEALTHATDPLAQYIQASQRRALGLLLTTEDARFAEEQLAAVAGKLPSQALEEKRKAAWEELHLWREAAEGGLRACLGLVDAARVLICGVCKMAFGMFPPALMPDNNNLRGTAGEQVTNAIASSASEL